MGKIRFHVQKTAITTPFGLWGFLRMPFGLGNVGETFQRLMHGIMQGLPRTTSTIYKLSANAFRTTD